MKLLGTRKILIIISIFFVFYAIFWCYSFKIFPFNLQAKSLLENKAVVISQNTKSSRGVLAVKDYNLPTSSIQPQKEIPSNYQISIVPRRQAFNLSCEFAAAATIIYHFTNNPDFSINNEKIAEQTLMEKIGTSDNPNIGIRMGEFAASDSATLYKNLNEKFGGTDYYGVHAPPFIDIFNSYGLMAKPIMFRHSEFSSESDLIKKEILNYPKSTSYLHSGAVQDDIKRAIFSGHLVMAWITVGFGKEIDVALNYGLSSAIKGEHSVVVTGYNQNGVFVMDPASNSVRYVQNNNFLDSIKLFPVPLLEVYPSTLSYSFDPSGPVDNLTKLNRGVVKIKIENASGQIGAASEMAGILKDFGYNVLEISNSDCLDCEDISVKIKKEFKDYSNLFIKDLAFATYKINTVSFDLDSENAFDMVMIIGK